MVELLKRLSLPTRALISVFLNILHSHVYVVIMGVWECRRYWLGRQGTVS